MPLNKPRIMGLETEYSILPNHRDEEAVHSVHPYLPDHVAITRDGFMSNGARFYVDCGHHPEYATPECLSGKSVAIAARAGSVIVRRTFENKFRSLKNGSDFSLTSRTIDRVGNSVASHENYFLGHAPQLEGLSRDILPHMISRIIFTGPGMVDSSGRYFLDQRAENMSDIPAGGGTTTAFRPFIADRLNGNHTDKGRRLQVIAGSANMMSWPVQFRFDSTSLVLRLIEYGLVPAGLQVGNAGHQMRAISHQNFGDNGRLDKTITLTNGKTITAPELQLEYASMAYNTLAEPGYLSEYETNFAKMWAEAAQDVVDGKIDRWKTRIEWLAKLDLLERLDAKRRRTLLEKSSIDLQYHLHARSGIHTLLRKNGLVEEVVTSQQVRNARYFSPDNTRARSRGDFIFRASEKSGEKVVGLTVDWHGWSQSSTLYTSEALTKKKKAALERLQNDPYSTEQDFEDLP